MSRERRKHKRFEIREEVFAALVAPDGGVIVGRVLDVSRSGVAVEYLATSKLNTGPAHISIFGSDSPRMNRVESTVMYDLEADGDSCGSLQMRRCGIRFEQRLSTFKTQLKELFRVNTAMEPQYSSA